MGLGVDNIVGDRTQYVLCVCVFVSSLALSFSFAPTHQTFGEDIHHRQQQMSAMVYSITMKLTMGSMLWMLLVGVVLGEQCYRYGEGHDVYPGDTRSMSREGLHRLHWSKVQSLCCLCLCFLQCLHHLRLFIF